MRPHKGHKHEKPEKVYDRQYKQCLDSINTFTRVCKECIDNDYYYDLREKDLAEIEGHLQKIIKIIVSAIDRGEGSRG